MTQAQTNEAIIMMALFQCTVEQTTQLTGTMKHEAKQAFKLWQNHGFKVLNHYEKAIPDFMQHIEKVADAIHSALSECKESAKMEAA